MLSKECIIKLYGIEMKSLFKSLTINRIYTFFGSREDLNDRIQQSNIDHNIVNDGLVEFAASISFGIGTKCPPIAVQVSIVEFEQDQIKIRIKTTIRPEHYFLLLFGAIFFIAAVFDADDAPALVYVLLGWPIFHLWSHFVFRVQENILAKKVAKALHLRRHQL